MIQERSNDYIIIPEHSYDFALEDDLGKLAKTSQDDEAKAENVTNVPSKEVV